MFSQFNLQKDAIDLNNQGAKLIIDGDYANAIDKITSGLKGIKQHMNQIGDSRKETLAEDLREEESYRGLDHWMIQTQVDHDDDKQEDCCYYENDNEEGFVHKSPITIEFETIPYSCYRSNVMVSIMMIFNLALSHQLSALQNKQSKSLMQKAVKIYKLALELQCEESRSQSSDILFVMTCVNNLGQCYYNLNDEVSAKKYFRRLLSSVMEAMDNGDCDSVNFQKFMNNISYLIFKKSSTAAAA